MACRFLYDKGCVISKFDLDSTRIIDSAELYLNLAKEIYLSDKNIGGVAGVAYRLAQLNLKLKNYKKAINLALFSFENDINLLQKVIVQNYWQLPILNLMITKMLINMS